MDEQEFRQRADQALDHLFQRLNKAGEQHEFEADFNAGTLVVEFEAPPAKFVVSPNSPVRQVWVSAQMKSYKLDWDATRETFALPGGGATLVELLGQTVGSQLGEAVTL